MDQVIQNNLCDILSCRKETRSTSADELSQLSNLLSKYIYTNTSDPFYEPYTFYTTICNDENTYYVYDHLGNTRITYTPTVMPDGLKFTLNGVYDYYPYGKILREYVQGQQEKYLTTHHQRDEETGLDYRGARFYDCDVARFLSLDPLAAQRLSISTFNYCSSNPIINIDPTGMLDTKYVDEDNNLLLDTKDGNNKKTVVVLDDQKEDFQKMVDEGNANNKIDAPSYNDEMTKKIEDSYNQGWQRYSCMEANITIGVQASGEVSIAGVSAKAKLNIATGTIFGGKKEYVNGKLITPNDQIINYVGNGDGQIPITQAAGISLNVGGEVGAKQQGNIAGGSNNFRPYTTTMIGSYELKTEYRTNTTKMYIYNKQGGGGSLLLGADAYLKVGIVKTTLNK
nr:RHS repeat-associated core domain-containing protein [Bacteroidota bacterium]